MNFPDDKWCSFVYLMTTHRVTLRNIYLDLGAFLQGFFSVGLCEVLIYIFSSILLIKVKNFSLLLWFCPLLCRRLWGWWGIICFWLPWFEGMTLKKNTLTNSDILKCFMFSSGNLKVSCLIFRALVNFKLTATSET